MTINLSSEQGGTQIALTQDKNDSAQAQAEAESNWGKMLEGMKDYIENRS